MRVRTWTWLAAIGLVALAVTTGADAAAAPHSARVPTVAEWVEVGPSGPIVRALTGVNGCPTASFDGTARSMTMRAPATANYPITTCEAAIPHGVSRVAVNGRRLSLPPRHPTRIAVLGDTGCRLKAADGFQACNDPHAWPFAQVARSIAAWHPDLVIQVGDYLYREEPCPAGDAGCRGSPYGQNWDTWNADFFTPAAPLLHAAPWVFVRGDHEMCTRAGPGWFRFLDPRPMRNSCANFTAPYALNFAGLQLIVLDDSDTVDPGALAVFRRQLATVDRLARPGSWLLGHKPVWGLEPNQDGSAVQVIDPVLEQAAPPGFPGAVDAIITGHVHLGEVLSFAGHRPPQLVAGIGGTLLVPNITTNVIGMNAAGEPITAATFVHQHGFFTFEPRGSGWAMTIRGVHGEPIDSCRLIDRSAHCTPRSRASE